MRRRMSDPRSPDAREAAPAVGSGGPPTAVALALILAVALAARLLALPGSRVDNMDPDSAHFLNIARCFERGQGFSNPAAWPAWMQPPSLPMPETIKEPGYPWLLWRLGRWSGDPFRAGILVSLLAGLALPLILYALARTLTRDRATALLAGLIAAGSPLLIALSVRVLVDSSFACAVTACFALAAWRPHGAAAPRRAWLDLAAGVALGAAFLLRGAAMIVAPALLVLLLQDRPLRGGLAGVVRAFAAAALTASPFIARNLRLFHTWYYSDIGRHGVTPYVDMLRFNAGLERPPAPLPFALAHVPQIARHWLQGAAQFSLHTFPEEILGHQWVLPLLLGVLLARARWRTHLFAYLYVGMTTAFIFGVNWGPRYFASALPLMCVFAALGAMAMLERLGSLRVAGRIGLGPALVALLALTLLVQAQMARQQVRRFQPAEIGAAIGLAPWLQAHLAPDEAVMAITTSFWSWFPDRPSVHFVIADEPRIREVVRRLRVRYAALPTSRLAELSARFPGQRLPRMFVPVRSDPALDITVFRIEADAAGAGPPGAPQ